MPHPRRDRPARRAGREAPRRARRQRPRAPRARPCAAARGPTTRARRRRCATRRARGRPAPPRRGRHRDGSVSVPHASARVSSRRKTSGSSQNAASPRAVTRPSEARTRDRRGVGVTSAAAATMARAAGAWVGCVRMIAATSATALSGNRPPVSAHRTRDSASSGSRAHASRAPTMPMRTPPSTPLAAPPAGSPLNASATNAPGTAAQPSPSNRRRRRKTVTPGAR